MNSKLLWICLMTLFLSLTLVAERLEAQVTQKKSAVGDSAPDFEVQTFDKKTVKLSDRFGPQGKPVVLVFSRGHW